MMHKRWLTLVFMLFLCACSSKESSLRDLARNQTQSTKTSIANLKTNLQNNTLENARILELYAQELLKLKPQYSDLIVAMQNNAEPDGPMVTALDQRLSDVVKSHANSIPELEAQLAELQSISIASLPAVFNDALSDSINVLADMSEGALPRVQAASRKTNAALNQAEYTAPGAQLIGNPQYGSWEQGANNDLIWKWGVAYLLFDNIFNRRSYYYSAWSQNRPYSYYHDYGRFRYSSPNQLNQQASYERRVAKSFQQQGQRFQSPYARKAAGGGQVSMASQSQSRPSSFRSQSAFSSSSRSGTSRISRGPRLGK